MDTLAALTPESAGQSLNYVKARPGARLWRLMLTAIAEELGQAATAQQAWAFMRGAGARVAGLLPAPEVETLGALEAHINRTWSEMDAGVVRLASDDAGVRITHWACANRFAEDAGGVWPACMAALLEGFYAERFREQGSPANMPTRCVSDAAADPLEFRHGA